MIQRITGLSESDPTIFEISTAHLEEFVSDLDGHELDLSCEGDYCGPALNDNEFKILISGLRRNYCVQSLMLWGNKEITESSANELKLILETNVTLTDINLDLTSITESSKMYIQRLLFDRRISRTTARHLADSCALCDLSRANLNDSNIVRVISLLKENTCIKNLSLWGNPELTDIGARLLKPAFTFSSNLEHVRLDMTGINDRFKIELLDIVNKNRFQKYIKCARENDPSCLTLQFSNLGLGGKEMAQLNEVLSSNTTVTKLVLSKNPNITSEHIATLFSIIHRPRLIHIEGDWNRFDAEAMFRFRTSMISSLKVSLVMQSKFCSAINLSGSGLNNDDAFVLLAAVQVNSTLQILNLSRNPLITDDIASCLHDAIKVNPVLSKINLTSTSCGFATLRSISEAIKKRRISSSVKAMRMSEVTDIDLRNLDLNDQDLTSIAQVMAICTSLRSLNISGNESVTDKGLEHLIAAADSVRTTFLLQRISLSLTSHVVSKQCLNTGRLFTV